MVKILFVCHGNICRSAMAEFIFKDMVHKADLDGVVTVSSAATSTEEIGNDTYPPAKAKLREKGIPLARHSARQITAADYNQYDYIVGMDSENMYYMNRCWNNDPEGKVSLLMEFAGSSREVADPWYTGDFERTYEDLVIGCKSLLSIVKNRIKQ